MHTEVKYFDNPSDLQSGKPFFSIRVTTYIPQLVHIVLKCHTHYIFYMSGQTMR